MTAAGLAALLALAAPARAADALDKTLPSFSVTVRPLRQALMALIAGGLTAGLAVDPATEPDVTLHVRGATRRQVLDGLMAQATGYAWAVSSGVVVVEPVSVSTASPLAALGGRVPSFAVSGIGVSAAVRVLRARAAAAGLPVERAMLPTARQLAFLAQRTPPGEGVSVSLSSVTLRDALDAVVRARRPSWWLATPLADGTLALLGDAVAAPQK